MRGYGRGAGVTLQEEVRSTSEDKQMRIAVIGAGHVGGTLGRRWAAAGHEVSFGVRDPEAGASAVHGAGDLPGTVRIRSVKDAVSDAEIVVLATPWAAVPDALAQAGEMNGLPLIDATNPVGAGIVVDAGPNGESGAERIQRLAPRASVVKALNTTGFKNMGNPIYGGAPATMFYAGADTNAKMRVAQLIRELGFEAIDAGGLARARELEHLAVLWISLANSGMGREFAFMLARR